MVVMACAFTPSLSSQTHYKANLSAGVKGGIEMSRMFFNPSVDQKFPIGFTFGGIFRYVEENHFGLQVEVNFAQRGWSNNFKDTGYSYRRTLNYIDIPVLAHIYFGRRGRFFVNLGPQVSFLVSESAKSNFDVNNIGSLTDFPGNERTNFQYVTLVENKVDFGICAGIGGEFNITPQNIISIEARFYYGLGNIFKADRQTGFRASNQMGIAATVGYLFRFK